MQTINGETYKCPPGTHFDLLLPDGTILNVEQTSDDFIICLWDGRVVASHPTSQYAKREDEGLEFVTGRF